MSDSTSRPAVPGGEPDKRMRAKHHVAAIARVAHELINDRGFTRAKAARMLANEVRLLNDEMTYQWTDEELALLIGDAKNV